MDFGFSSEQEDIRTVSGKIFGDLCRNERMPDFEKASERMDAELWKALAEASLLGVALPESHGGMGFGIAELGILLEQAGRFAAPIPLFPTLVLGAAPIAQFGSDAQKDRWLRDVAAGETVLTGAIAEPDSRDAEKPSTRAKADGTGWILDGVKICVPAAKLAARILVPAATADGKIVLALVSPEADGVTLDLKRLAVQTAAILVCLVLAGRAPTRFL